MDFGLQNKGALVTGGSKGIGKAIALELDSGEVEIDLPWMFRNTVSVAVLKGGLDWRSEPGGVELKSTDFLLESPGVRSSSTFRLLIPSAPESPRLELNSKVRDVDVARALQYLPATAP